MATTKKTTTVREYGERAPAGIDLSAFQVPSGMVVSSITLSQAPQEFEEEPEEDEDVEERRRAGRYPRGR